jgi:tRNA(fMet)-specific endonuclease VapC
LINLLDTNVCIDLLRKRSPRIAARVAATPIGDLGISSISAAELLHGASASPRAVENAEAADALMSIISVLPFDVAAARFYGGLRARLESVGQAIGPFDLLIAGHALALGATLITNNVREFERVPGLIVEDWTH